MVILSDRTPIRVNPKGIGPVTELNENDVLCGRGGRINGHPGNIQFRQFCSDKRDQYLRKETKKSEKACIAAKVVERIRSLNPTGRFLKQEWDGWYDIGCAKAAIKVGQAIREQTSKSHQREDAKKASRDNDTTVSLVNIAIESSHFVYTPLKMDQDNQDRNLAECSKKNDDLNVFYPSLAPRKENRLSVLSSSVTMSGPMRMSTVTCLMRASVKSDFSDGMSLAEPDSGGLRQHSFFSEISDGMSLIRLGDECYNSTVFTSQDVGVRCGNDAKHEACTQPGGERSSRRVETRDAGKSTGRPKPERRRSIWSISMGSTLSFDSFGSVASLSPSHSLASS